MRPLVIDLYCGLGGWSRAFLDEGYDAVGFDVERHVYGEKRYPGQLVLQDVLTLHGSQFKHAACIVASSPCQKYSYMAMPWTRAKEQAKWYREVPARIEELNALFLASFRIQREASEAAGRYIPLIAENVKGAQPWVGMAKAHFGSYYLWGDIESVGDRITVGKFGQTLRPGKGRKFNPDGTEHGQGSWFAVADSKNRGAQKREGRNFHAFENGLGSSPAFNGGEHETRGVKTVGHINARDGYNHTRHLTNSLEHEGVKQRGSGDAWWDKSLDDRRREATAIKNGGDWFGSGENMRANSQSTARKAASAMIAEIPYDLAQWIARCFKPANDTARFPPVSQRANGGLSTSLARPSIG